MCEESR